MLKSKNLERFSASPWFRLNITCSSSHTISQLRRFFLAIRLFLSLQICFRSGLNSKTLTRLQKMTDPNFDIQRYIAKQLRAKRRAAHGADFLYKEAAQIIGERLAVTNRNFVSPALLFDGQFSDTIEDNILAENPPVSGKFQRIIRPVDEPQILDMQPESLDLIVSVFDLNRVNSLPNILLQITHALKPDGLFMAIILSEGTLDELRNAVLTAEAEMESAASSRIDLFPHIRQLGDLVRKIGLKLPVVDLEERTVRYGSVTKLIKDLRDTGSGNCNHGEIRPLTRLTWQRMEEIYKTVYGDMDGKIRATFAMACISGWKEDESQQKPLKPGSAKSRLSDFL